eukprot:7642688-Pyramimonas_sp.AAC.1
MNTTPRGLLHTVSHPAGSVAQNPLQTGIEAILEEMVDCIGPLSSGTTNSTRTAGTPAQG